MELYFPHPHFDCITSLQTNWNQFAAGKRGSGFLPGGSSVPVDLSVEIYSHWTQQWSLAAASLRVPFP